MQIKQALWSYYDMCCVWYNLYIFQYLLVQVILSQSFFVYLIKHEFYIYNIFVQIGLILCLLIGKNQKTVLLYFSSVFCLCKMFRVGVRKAKTQMELNLARNAKKNKEGFFRCIGQKRQAKESVSPADKQIKRRSGLLRCGED